MIIETKFNLNQLVYTLNHLHDGIIPGHVKNLSVDAHYNNGESFNLITYTITPAVKSVGYEHTMLEDFVYGTAEEAQQALRPEH